MYCWVFLIFQITRANKKSAYLHNKRIDCIANPLIVRFLAQAGTFHTRGVAVTSQILCISITLNKGYYYDILLFVRYYHTLFAGISQYIFIFVFYLPQVPHISIILTYFIIFLPNHPFFVLIFKNLAYYLLTNILFVQIIKTWKI